jgi:hypothetical protein
MWNILHFGLACVCAAATHPCSFLVSFTFSTLLSYISLNPRTQLQNWLKEIWDLVTKYHNNKEGSRLRSCIWEWRQHKHDLLILMNI